MGTARFVYNKTIEHLSQPKTVSSWMKIKTEMIKSLPDWSEETPYQIKSIAIKEACTTVSAAKRKFKQTKEKQKCKFRSRKNPSTVYVPKSSMGEFGCFPRYLGKSLNPTEEIGEANYDCKIKFEFNRWFLIVPSKINAFDRRNVSENQGHSVVALDPGVRSFQTFYSTNGFCGKIGAGDFASIMRLCLSIDHLKSEMSKSKSNARRRQRLKKIETNVRFRIRNLVDELHHKTALFLCQNFKVILLPTFETSEMVKKQNRKIRSKTVRAMLTWAHYRFKMFLKFKAQEFGSIILDVNEAYTSKTCSVCGAIKQNLGGSKVLKCKNCGTIIDRDYNGARGILLRALVDSPLRLDENEVGVLTSQTHEFVGEKE
jgi:putative transposase